MRRYKRDEILAAVRGSGGNVSEVARRLGCSWHTARSYVDKWESTRTAFDCELEELLDEAEIKLRELILAGDGPAIRFYLSTKGRKRGYVTRSEVSGPDESPIRVCFLAPDRFPSPEAWEAAMPSEEPESA